MQRSAFTKRRFTSLYALLAISLSSCATPTDDQTITLKTLARSQHCGVANSEPYWLAVTKASDLPAEFSEVTANGPFWLVGLGEKPTGGYSIDVAEQASRQGQQIQATVTITRPGAGRAVTQAFTNPCVLLAASATGMTDSLWQLDGQQQLVPIQPYRAAQLRHSWQ